MPKGVYQRISPAWNKGLPKEKQPMYGKHHPEELRRRLVVAMCNAWRGKKHTEETRKRMSEIKQGLILSEETRSKMREAKIGAKNHNWIPDRTKLAKKQERNDSAYFYWRKEVWLRDNWKCRIANSDCNGRIEAHHILNWSKYPELRYEINNGITLCHAHHPRKRAEEKLLIPEFQRLVGVYLGN